MSNSFKVIIFCLSFMIVFFGCKSTKAEKNKNSILPFHSLELIKTVKTDKQPKQVCFHSGRQEMYVANMNDASGRSSPELKPGSLQIFSVPDSIMLHSENARTAVECLVENDYIYYSDMFRDEVVKFDLIQRKVLFRIPIKSALEKNLKNANYKYMPKIIIHGPGPDELTISTWFGGVSVINSKTGLWSKTVPAFCSHPRGILYNEKNQLVVMCYGVPDGPGQMMLLDSADNFKILQKNVTGGSARHIVAAGPNRALVSNLGLGQIQEIDTSNLKIIRRLYVGGQPNSTAMDPDQNHLYISQRGSNTISVLDTKEWKIVHKYITGAYPTGLGISPDGKYLAVTNFHDASLNLYRVIRHKTKK